MIGDGRPAFELKLPSRGDVAETGLWAIGSDGVVDIVGDIKLRIELLEERRGM